MGKLLVGILPPQKMPISQSRLDRTAGKSGDEEGPPLDLNLGYYIGEVVRNGIVFREYPRNGQANGPSVGSSYAQGS